MALLAACGGSGGTMVTPPPAASSPTPSPSTNPPPTAAERTLAAIRAQAAIGREPPLSAMRPVITVGTVNTASQIPGSVLIAWDNLAFIYTGKAVIAGPTYPDNQFARFDTVSFSATDKQSNAVDIEFQTDAPAIELMMKGIGPDSTFRLQVDGQLASATPVTLPNDLGFYLVKVEFGSRASRRIRVNALSPRFGGVRVAAGDSLSASPQSPNRFRAIFFGDSIVANSAGQARFTSFAPIAAQLLGWEETWISGVGSTGYLRAVPATRLTLRQRLMLDIVPYKPDVLVIASGINDLIYGYSEVNAEARLLFDDIQRELPQTIVFVLGPWNPRHIVPAPVNAAIKDAAAGRQNFYWIANYDEPWITGTGRVGSPAGDGNSDIYTSGDGVHPSAAGIDYYAVKFAAAVRAAIAQ